MAEVSKPGKRIYVIRDHYTLPRIVSRVTEFTGNKKEALRRINSEMSVSLFTLLVGSENLPRNISRAGLVDPELILGERIADFHNFSRYVFERVLEAGCRPQEGGVIKVRATDTTVIVSIG